MSKKKETIIFKNLSEQNLKDYCNFFEKNKLQELLIEENDIKITFKNNVQRNNYENKLINSQGFQEFIQEFKTNTNTNTNNLTETFNSKKEIEPKAKSNEKEIVSPVPGTFYEAPSPKDAPYVKVGDVISKGDKICIIEAMKVMNEIESPYDGKVTSILVKNAGIVAQNQPIFIIESL